MAFTRKQTASVSFNYADQLVFHTIEARPVYAPAMMPCCQEFEVQVNGDDGNVYRWFADETIQRLAPDGTLTTWGPVMTLNKLVNTPPIGLFCKLTSYGALFVEAEGYNYYYGPPVPCTPVEGTLVHSSPHCCVDDHIDECCERFRYSGKFMD